MKSIRLTWLLIAASVFIPVTIAGQDIGDFVSITPGSESSDFVIPSTHQFQVLIQKGDPLTAGGVMLPRFDFTGYVPIGGSSANGYLGVNSETPAGGMVILDITLNTVLGLWQVTASEEIDFSPVVKTSKNCSGAVTPWGTLISCEEDIETNDSNGDGYRDIGWAVEINPATKTVIDKRWAMGNFKHENATIHANQRTVYQGIDDNTGYLYKFVATTPQDLSSGLLYVYSGSKNGSGNWILINNTTPSERNSTVNQSTSAGGTVFDGIEDVEIGPDGKVYFAVKNENAVYRFQDSDPITGTTVTNMEIFVGNTSYDIDHAGGTTSVSWGWGNDNLAFDGVGNLWVYQDGNTNYIWVVKTGHTQANPLVEIFGNVPKGAEPTGVTFSPDFKYMFMSIQEPNTSNNSTTQTDAAGNPVAFDKDAVLAISRITGTVLSIELLSFEAKALQNSIHVTWATASEENLAFFELERSTDKKSFTTLTKIPGHGRTSGPHRYAFEDHDMGLDKVFYYRLKQVDINGGVSYSGWISSRLVTSVNIFHQLNLLPNPSNGSSLKVHFTGTRGAQQVAIQILNLEGRIVKEHKMDGKPGLNETVIDLTGLSPSIYYVQVKGSGTQSLVKRFVKVGQ